MAPSPRSIKLVLAAAALALTVARARKNLALHKPCTASSTRFGDPSAVVNGVIEWGTYGLQTWSDHPSWLVVDLQGTFRLDEVRLFGRGDWLTGEEAGPIEVQTSLDGSTFTQVGTCVHVFSQASPCKVQLGGASARYVRLQYPYLVVSELEVFEAR